MKLAFLVLLASAYSGAAPNYSDIRTAESKKFKALFEAVSPDERAHSESEAYNKILSAHDAALAHLSQPLIDFLPKFNFGSNYDVETTAFPNLFLRGDEDSYCYEGMHLTITKKGKRGEVFYGHLANETLLRDADEALSIELPSWHREKGNGVENSPDATEVLTEVYCDGASHTQIRKLKNGFWLVSVSQDTVVAPTHLVGLRRINENFLFVKSALPISYLAKLKCPKKIRGEKAQIKCLNEEITDKMLEPFAKPLKEVLAAFQIVT